MIIQCPHCQSTRIVSKNVGKKTGSVIGAVGGATSTLSGAEIGASIGVIGGPAGVMLGGLLGALIGSIAGAKFTAIKLRKNAIKNNAFSRVSENSITFCQKTFCVVDCGVVGLSRD